MKKLVFGLLVFACIAQVAPVVIPPKANTLIVHSQERDEAAWRQAGRALAATGFAIKNSSRDLLTLTTEPKDIGRGQKIALSLSVKDSLITMTATQFTPSLGESAVDYRGMQGSPARRGWEAFEKATRAIGDNYHGEKR